jgi:cysteinyl-tRNA synthetase
MDQGEGIEGAERKEDPLDFALWKGEKEGEDTAWPSPWGPGRPGWHIECSAMAEELLGVELDIHGGGADLLFPHHENEAAQTLAARGRPLARLWVHNGMLQLGDDKMAKSVGNIRGLAEVLDEVGRDALILYFAAGHYRQPIAYTRERLDAAAASVERIREAGRRVVDGESPEELAPLRDAFFDALADDFNTARALASLFDWIREANRRESPVGGSHLREMLAVLALDNLLEAEEGPPAELVALAERRASARAERDFAEADRLRDELRAAGWEVRDGPAGPELVPADRLRRQPGARGSPRPAAGAADLGGQGRMERGARRAGLARVDHGALRLGRSPGRLRRRRGVPLRRRGGAARAPRAVPGRPRRGDRPPEPRRGVPDGRVRRRDGRRPARAPLR